MAANGERNVSRERVIELIKAHEGQPLTLEVQRDGQPIPITVTPHKVGGIVRIGAQISAVANPGRRARPDGGAQAERRSRTGTGRS